MIQEWWGLTDHIAECANRLAGEGFVALAPDLFGGTTTHDADEAGKLMQDLPVEQAAQDLGGAVDYLLGHDSVTSRRSARSGSAWAAASCWCSRPSRATRSAPQCRSTGLLASNTRALQISPPHCSATSPRTTSLSPRPGPRSGSHHRAAVRPRA